MNRIRNGFNDYTYVLITFIFFFGFKKKLEPLCGPL